jgi:hypothetical protein
MGMHMTLHERLETEQPKYGASARRGRRLGRRMGVKHEMMAHPNHALRVAQHDGTLLDETPGFEPPATLALKAEDVKTCFRM